MLVVDAVRVLAEGAEEAVPRGRAEPAEVAVRGPPDVVEGRRVARGDEVQCVRGVEVVVALLRVVVELLEGRRGGPVDGVDGRVEVPGSGK